MTAQVERFVTSGTFQLDDSSGEADNKVWLVGNNKVGRGIDATATATGGGERRVTTVVCTHA